jgi:hypothetical protein
VHQEEFTMLTQIFRYLFTWDPLFNYIIGKASPVLGRVFWSLFAFEAAGLLIFTFYFLGRGTKGWGPEGPVGAWLIVIPPIMLLAPAAVVLIRKTDYAKLGGIFCLALPLLHITLGPLYTVLTNYQTKRRLAGDNTFFWPAQRRLAHAIRAHDIDLVRRLIPGAGDLNAIYGGETLLRFALINADTPGAPFEAVKALLDAGADPNICALSKSPPLTLAISSGPKFTEALLKAGADPNRVEESGKPLWWDALTSDSDERLRTLEILLDHNADLTKRDSEGGPIGWAAYMKSWRAMWRIMERGAEWKDQGRFGQSVSSMLASDLSYRQAVHSEISGEMLKAMARLKGQPPAQ